MDFFVKIILKYLERIYKKLSKFQLSNIHQYSAIKVEEVIGIMHTNVENVLERDRKLGDLEERADALQDGCAQFEKQAAAMKNKFWLENLKVKNT